MGRPKGDRKKEHYYREAKKHGYRARSAYKLKQIIKKQNLLAGVDKVVELCSSPGGWTQVLRQFDRSLEIVAVDLNSMPPVENVKFVQGDITKQETIDEIIQLIGGSADLVLSDCAPNVTGQWEIDVARQLALAECTINLGCKILGAKGKVLAKVFQGPGFQEFMQMVRNLFSSVRLIKPDASRRTSAEIYLLAENPRR
ncbi:MAG: RlmE family RNA methyltransferase [Candidatus Thorarchaeota archaeon]|nr:RlmE family RNA methyltransferase [Candidatus Thorarchaeota archaeon]